MKTPIKWLAIMAAILFSACNRQSFTVEGTIEGAQDSTLYFENASLQGLVTLDSVRLAADGSFSFSHERPEAPEFYVLRINDQIINLSIDSTETVTVRAQWPDMAARYEVSGSANCATIRTLALKQQDLQRRAIRLEQTPGLTRQQVLDSLNAMLAAYKRDVTENFIYQQPAEASSYFALFQTLGPWLIFDPRSNPDDVKAIAAVATSWDTFHPGALRGENLHNIAIEAMNNNRLVAAKQMMVIDEDKIVESGCIELKLNDNNGRQQSLNALRGKVVLLDFHTFTLKDSPQRILMLRDLYNKYHDRGLEIYQVSLDQDEHFWKQMTQQLPWISVRDTEGQSAVWYNVQTLPEFFLIDRNNQLQKRSTQVSDLDAEIARLL
ncbi:MAG: AhpC/TSA family protein [Prevotella sp.]|nr:AhpC/TSA family protein [Prevotella sp.]